MRVRVFPVIVAAMLCLGMQSAMAQARIGFVDSDRLMREAAPAVKAQQRLEKEFEQRDKELQRMAQELQGIQEELERNSLTMVESDKRGKERAFNELNRDFQRKQREFREDLNSRRNEELATVLERANVAIKQIAEAEKFDIVLQEAVFASPRVDITEKVIKALGEAR